MYACATTVALCSTLLLPSVAALISFNMFTSVCDRLNRKFNVRSTSNPEMRKGREKGGRKGWRREEGREKEREEGRKKGREELSNDVCQRMVILVFSDAVHSIVRTVLYCTVLYFTLAYNTVLYVPSTRIFLSLSTRSLYTSSLTSECWNELEKEEAVTVSEGPLNVAGIVGTAITVIIIMILIINILL